MRQVEMLFMRLIGPTLFTKCLIAEKMTIVKVGLLDVHPG